MAKAPQQTFGSSILLYSSSPNISERTHQKGINLLFRWIERIKKTIHFFTIYSIQKVQSQKIPTFDRADAAFYPILFRTLHDVSTV